jgi:hypothetical protein
MTRKEQMNDYGNRISLCKTTEYICELMSEEKLIVCLCNKVDHIESFTANVFARMVYPTVV